MDVIFYVIWCREERLNRMVKQFSDMKFPYKIVLFEGTNPELSKDWIDKDSEYCSPKLQSCMRSHILALADFYIKHPDKKYICIIEDDVCFLKENFLQKLEEVISVYEKNKDIEYVSLGYLPWITDEKSPISSLLDLFKKDNFVYYDFTNIDFTFWGAQMYIVEREQVKKALQILYKPSAKEVIESAQRFINIHGYYQNKDLLLTPDSILSLILKQGFCFPMLGIEGLIDSTIHGKYAISDRFHLWKKMDEFGILKFEDYYSF